MSNEYWVRDLENGNVSCHDIKIMSLRKKTAETRTNKWKALSFTRNNKMGRKMSKYFVRIC